MRIICLVKFVLDPQQISSNENSLNADRKNSKLILNPDDACALAFALRYRKQQSDVSVSVVTMGPMSVKTQLADLVRRGVDEAILISDNCYAGSDTLATSKILAQYLSREKFDYIYSGTHSLDGDTSHVPSQLSQLLNLPQLSSVIDLKFQTHKNVGVLVDTGDQKMEFVMQAPAIISFNQRQQLRLPFVRFHDLELDVSDKIHIIDNQLLNIPLSELGINGSKTRVVATIKPELKVRQQQCFTNSPQDLQQLFELLIDEGLIV